MKIKKFDEVDKPIKLGNSVGRCVVDYLNIMQRKDMDKAKEYLKLWMGDVPNAKDNIITTLIYFKVDKNLIETTKKLLNEI